MAKRNSTTIRDAAASARQSAEDVACNCKDEAKRRRYEAHRAAEVSHGQ